MRVSVRREGEEGGEKGEERGVVTAGNKNQEAAKESAQMRYNLWLM